MCFKPSDSEKFQAVHKMTATYDNASAIQILPAEINDSWAEKQIACLQ
jgi:hypothetical protein